MDGIQPLLDFFAAIRKDFRISAAHIGVFAALLAYRISKGNDTVVKVFSKDIMPIAKISSPSTYLRCVRELHDYGYIVYKPSYKKTVASTIQFK
ncbi:hypothetical protein AMR72_00070 [Flavobacterium psychrophilum]|nr:hypothetical protein AMR72_00070 [Flavobacterium psychrophilum]AOE51051.1 hypothetical protein ALW18_00070 [Flavobacterium psychrophilum]